jgi:pimeloyl-ACP methyl ester carboxylesterase
LTPFNLAPTLIYPTAPNRLRASDIPGYQPSETDGDEEETDSWAWYRKDEASGAYRLLNEGMLTVAESIRAAVVSPSSGTDAADESSEPPSSSAPAAAGGGSSSSSEPIAGVIGFSQGGSMAAMLAAAMESSSSSSPTPRTVPEGPEWEWVRAVREANNGQPLKFAVIYSGFYAPPQELAWLYEPRIRTPTLQFIGSLDTVVDESRSRGLVTRCEDPVVVVHPGGHHVPVSKEWVMPLVGFIKKVIVDDAKE